MKKAKIESIIIAKYIHTFLSEYVPFQGYSNHTAKSHEDAISLYIAN